MNQPLRRVAIAVMAMIVLLLANATYVQVIKADDFRTDPRNARVLIEEYSRQRGQIVAEGTPLAQSVETGNSQLRFQRQYADGPIYAPVTGYYSTLYGAGGVEKVLDSVLNGSDDLLFVRRLSDLITGRDLRGGNVVLTINRRAQQVAYEQMTAKGFRGAVVAIAPKTGEILAMVSTPSYDPNVLAVAEAKAQQQAWNQLNTGERPISNRAVRETYPPGSTFKLLITAAALSSGDYDENSPLTAAPEIQLPGSNADLENFNGNRCGSGETATLRDALARSCNTAFAELAMALGADRLRETAEAFGIGQADLQVPLQVVPSAIGPMADRPAVAQTGIGQRDVRLTPLQNAMIVATIANGGERMTPYLVSKLTDPDLEELDTTDPETADRVMDRDVAETLRSMMIASEERTKGEKIPGVTVASKTGTAEYGSDPKANPPHGWYVAFAPAEDPQVAIAVIVEGGGDRGLEATGGSIAAPIARAVMQAVLQGAG
ncbi:MAG TPA: penicillin-binding protein 2 [Pseudonocardiaceae bacterium]